jgi:biotin synthase
VDEVCFAADRAKKAGAIRFSIVASGKGATILEIEIYASIISKIRAEIDIKLCASLGIIDTNSLKILKQAGLSRYHHNIETSQRFYPEIVSSHPFEDRARTINNAKKAGLEICAGGILNLGENWDDRLSMIDTLSGLDVDSIPLNILVPIPGTPLETAKPIEIKDILRTIAMFRISFPEKLIIIAGGREASLGDFQSLAYWAGADGMMIGGYLTISGNETSKDVAFMKKFLGLS